MKPSMRRLLWTVGGTMALAALGLTLERSWRKSEPMIVTEEDLRDAVASPAPAASRIALGRPAPVSYFAGPSARHAEIENVLLSRRRALRRQ